MHLKYLVNIEIKNLLYCLFIIIKFSNTFFQLKCYISTMYLQYNKPGSIVSTSTWTSVNGTTSGAFGSWFFDKLQGLQQSIT